MKFLYIVIKHQLNTEQLFNLINTKYDKCLYDISSKLKYDLSQYDIVIVIDTNKELTNKIKISIPESNDYDYLEVFFKENNIDCIINKDNISSLLTSINAPINNKNIIYIELPNYSNIKDINYLASVIERFEYILNPCRMLSIPFWKSKLINIPNDIDIIHQDDFHNQYNNYQRFFRLKHQLNNVDYFNEDVVTIDILNDKDELKQMINDCYQSEGIKFNIEMLINSPTFNPELWVMIKKDNKIIASGIGEYDNKCQEGILEWIQVMPLYQRQGYGKMIVKQLLNNIKSLGARFVSVSGNLDNPNNPEKLYRQCGFTGDDVWYICNKDKTK